MSLDLSALGRIHYNQSSGNEVLEGIEMVSRVVAMPPLLLLQLVGIA